MGILNRLWTELWNSEQRSKERHAENIYNMEVVKLQRAREAQVRESSPLQAIAERHGLEPSLDLATYGTSPAVSAGAYQQTAQHLLSTALSNSQTLQAQNALTNVNIASAQNLFAQQNTIPAAYTSVTNPRHVTYLPPNLANASPMRNLGTAYRDTLFLALKGIEEAALKAPKGNHPYDDQAIKLLDLRNFKPPSVSLLQLCSFCVSNCHDPAGLIELLEGFGFVVEA